MGILADASSEGNEIGSGYVGGSLDQRLADIVDFALVKAEAVATRTGIRAFVRRILDDVFEVVSDEFEELFEDCSGFGLVQWSHLCC